MTDAAQNVPVAATRRRPSDVLFGVVGVVGELLITLGVVLGLFVVWQLWWTDVQAARAQEQIVAGLDWPRPSSADAPVAGLRTGPPPTLDEPTQDGETIALLSVPRWDGQDAVTVRQGVDRPTILDTGSGGHYPGTAMPGGIGNFAVAGHRTTYGKPFNRIAELEPGDALVVRTADLWFVYRVTGHRIVLPEQVDVVAPVPGEPGAAPERATITLTACHPMFSARERYIVHGELEGWMPVADGVPAALTEGA